MFQIQIFKNLPEGRSVCKESGANVKASLGTYLTGISAQAKFVRHSLLFTTSLVIGAFCNLIRSFVIAKLLGPQGFGTWRFINIFLEYLPFSSFGTQPAMNQRIPFLRGKGDRGAVQEVVKTAFAANFFSAIIYSSAIFIWSWSNDEADAAKVLAVFCPVMLLVACLNYTKELAISTELYGLRTRLEAAHGILTTLISVPLVFFGGIYGAIVGLGLSTAMVLIPALYSVTDYFAVKIEWRVLRELVITGFPMMVNGIFLLTMANVDRILIAAMLSRETLGIYSIANVGTGILATVPSALGQMLVVKFSEMSGQNKSKEDLADIVDKATFTVSTLYVAMLCVAMALFPIIVVVLLPQYVEGIAAGKLLIAGTFFLAVSLPATNLCVSMKRFLPVLLMRGLVVTMQFVAVYSVITHGANLETIALCVLSAFALFYGAMVIVSHHILEKTIRVGLLRVVKNSLPFTSILLAWGVQDVIYPAADYSVKAQVFWSCMLSLVVSILASIPFIYWAQRRTRFATLLWNGA
jgi:O-antigen/teichoic acid export membrane protein